MFHITHTQVFAEADFLELDATYHAASELEYLINFQLHYNALPVKYTSNVLHLIRPCTCKTSALDHSLTPFLGMVVARVRISDK